MILRKQNGDPDQVRIPTNYCSILFTEPVFRVLRPVLDTAKHKKEIRRGKTGDSGSLGLKEKSSIAFFLLFTAFAASFSTERSDIWIEIYLDQ